MTFLRRTWRELASRSSGDRSPTIGIAIVVAATAVVLAAGWVLAVLASLVY